MRHRDGLESALITGIYSLVNSKNCSNILLPQILNNYHAGDTIATSRVESYQKIIISVFFVYGGADFEPRYQLIDMVLFVCSCS